MKKKVSFIIAVLTASLIIITLQNCKTGQTGTNYKKAVAVLIPAEGSKVKGVVVFTEENGGVKIKVNLEGLTPGEHGFHIHDFGDISDMKGMSAGGHFNPTNKKHGAPTDAERHVGDLGNITADKDGKVDAEFTDKIISLNGVYSIIGHSVVVHADADDFKTQPTGNAGGRVAFGVIGIGNDQPSK